jgi:mersacidin/lichenicidin family type 2 lantibiotic
MNIARAWKDPEYRATLSDDELAAMPEHPCGPVELGDEALALVAGARTEGLYTLGCCGGFTAKTTACGSCKATCRAATCNTCEGQSTCGMCTA